jgi:regulator of sigma E protease
MTLVVSIILFILIIGLLIFVHEFGHYFAAKRNGIGVTEFAIGMGPKLFSWQRKETRFSVRMIPIGGYCLFLGDDSGLVPEDEEEAEEEMDEEERKKQEEFRATHSYASKSVWQRISVVLAGPFVNMLVAFLFACLLIGLVGATDTKISAVSEDYPAGKAGLQAGDVITKLDHTRVHIFKDITLYMTMHEGEELTVEYTRNGEQMTTTLMPEYNQEEQRYLIGIKASPRRENLNILEVVKYGWYEFTYNAGAVIKSLGMLVTGKLSFNDLSGPVGIAGTVNDIVDEVVDDTKEEGFWVTAYWVFINMLSFTVLISANLGIMNLLPIPGLDGGRLIFLILEVFRGKPIPKKYEGIVTAIGFVLLLLLMAAVFFNDIRKLIWG